MGIQLLSKEEVELKIRAIDERVVRLEKTNDNYVATHGCYNDGIYQLIQDLMEKRDELRKMVS
jgi:hypothetical protein